MRPKNIVVGAPAVGATLLGERMLGGMGGDFNLIHPVHLFMGCVVFGMSGPAKVDADTQTPPPDRQTREAARAATTKGWTVVHTDDFGQTVTAEDAGQHASNGGIALVGQEPDIQQEAALEIAHGQRFDAGAVARTKPAFEINRPYIVGSTGYRTFGWQ